MVVVIMVAAAAQGVSDSLVMNRGGVNDAG